MKWPNPPRDLQTDRQTERAERFIPDLNRLSNLNGAGAGAGAGSSSTGMVAESPSLSGMAIARAGSLLPSRYALILERS